MIWSAFCRNCGASVIGQRSQLTAILLFWLGAMPMLAVFNAPTHGDVRLYHRVEEELINGIMPYRDRDLEYPPYAIPIFLVPRLLGSELPEYQTGFAILVVLADTFIKLLLFFAGQRHNTGVRSLLPFAFYCITV